MKIRISGQNQGRNEKSNRAEKQKWSPSGIDQLDTQLYTSRWYLPTPLTLIHSYTLFIEELCKIFGASWFFKNQRFGIVPMFRRTVVSTYRYFDKCVPIIRQMCTDISTCRNIGIYRIQWCPLFRHTRMMSKHRFFENQMWPIFRQWFANIYLCGNDLENSLFECKSLR